MATKTLIISYSGGITSPMTPLLIDVSPTDLNGFDSVLSTGNPLLPNRISNYRVYNTGDVVTLTAPPINDDGNNFYCWEINGVLGTVGQNVLALTMNSNKSAIAVYSVAMGTIEFIVGQHPQKRRINGNNTSPPYLPVSYLADQPNLFYAQRVVGPGGETYLWSTAAVTSGITVNGGGGSTSTPVPFVLYHVLITDPISGDHVTIYTGTAWISDENWGAQVTQPNCIGISAGTVLAHAGGVVPNSEGIDAPSVGPYTWTVTGFGGTPQSPTAGLSNTFVFTDGAFLNLRLNNFFDNLTYPYDTGPYFFIYSQTTGHGVSLTMASGNSTDVLVPNGYAIANVSGGTGPYIYQWSNGGTGAQINGLPAGAYTVVVTDANGCSVTGTVNINQPYVGSNYYDIQAAASKAECCAGKLGAAIIAKQENGQKVCCEDETNFYYITGIASILRNYIPAGTIVIPAIFSSVQFAIASDSDFTDVTITIDGVVVLSGTGLSLATRQDLIDYIIANIGGGFTVTNPSLNVIVIYAPDETYNDVIVDLLYIGKVTSHHTLDVMSGGVAAIVRTQEQNCLTPEEINILVANVNELCGCCTSFTQVVTTGAPSGVPFIPGGGGGSAPISIWKTAADFSGSDLVIPELIGKKIVITPDDKKSNFEVSTGGVDQSGTLVHPPYYSIDARPSITGTLTFANGPEPVRILIY